MREELVELIMNAIYLTIEDLWDANVKPILEDDADCPKDDKEWTQANELTNTIKYEFCNIMGNIEKENPRKKENQDD